MNVIDFAHDILDMQDRIRHLEAENAALMDYKQKYISLLNGNLEHNQAMMLTMLDAVMTPGVIDAMQQRNGNKNETL